MTYNAAVNMVKYNVLTWEEIQNVIRVLKIKPATYSDRVCISIAANNHIYTYIRNESN